MICVSLKILNMKQNYDTKLGLVSENEDSIGEDKTPSGKEVFIEIPTRSAKWSNR
jgi:hypothetical protein